MKAGNRHYRRAGAGGADRPDGAAGLAAAVTVALAAGIMLAGSAALGRRREHQRQRLSEYRDSAPERARRAPPSKMALAGYAVTINRPRGEVYAFWRDFPNLASFMSNVERVIEGEPGRSVWTIAAPGGFSVDLHTEIIEDVPDALIAWRSVPGSDIEAEGRVSFRDAPGGRGTIVAAEIAYRPPAGELGRWIAKLFQREPSIQGRRELKRLKMLLEAGEIATSANRKS